MSKIYRVSAALSITAFTFSSGPGLPGFPFGFFLSSGPPCTICIDVKGFNNGIPGHASIRIEIGPVIPDPDPARDNVPLSVHVHSRSVPLYKRILRHSSIEFRAGILIEIIPYFVDILPSGQHLTACTQVIPSCRKLDPAHHNSCVPLSERRLQAHWQRRV